MSSAPGIWSRALFNFNRRGWRRIFARYPEAITSGLRVRALVSGSLNSALEAMQERLYGGQLDATELRAPVFIVGHWRSGTTLLHELLALDVKLVSPTTRQCFSPHSFLLSKAPASSVSVVRPSGDRAVSADSPQEEEFALLCLGCPSPYEAFLFPRALSQVAALSDPAQFDAQERAQWERRLVRFLKAVSLVGGPRRRLLLKSPSNSMRIGTLRRLFPDAVFVQITREPSAVVNSTIDMWRKMWERYALEVPPPDSVVQQAAIDCLLRLEERLHDDIGKLSDQAVAIRYEDLVGAPQRAIGTIYERLKIGARPSDEQIHRFLRDSPPLRPTAPANRELAASVRERCAGLYQRYGYG